MATPKPSFTTTDTGLAAFLVVCGLKVSKLDTASSPAVFTFENNSLHDTERLQFEWDNGLTPLKTFYLTYRSFIRQIKEDSQ